MAKKVNKGLLEQMTSTEWFNYISALKQMKATIARAKDNVSENDNGYGDVDVEDYVDEDKSSDRGESQDYNVWVDGEDDNY